MDKSTKEKIEEFLKKAGLTKVSGKDIWVRGKTPHMQVCDLTAETPWVGVSTGVERQEAESCGVIAVQDLKTQVMNFVKTDIKKSPEDVSHNTSTPQEDTAPLPPVSSSPVSGDESHKKSVYFCTECKTDISAEQRASSFKTYKKSLCEKCIPTSAPTPAIEPTKTKEKKEEGAWCTECRTAQHTDVTQDEKYILYKCHNCNTEWRTELPTKAGWEDKAKGEIKKEKKKPPVPLATPVKEEPNTPKTNVPAVQEKAQPPALSDADLDAKIEKTKTKRFLQNQAGSYRVNGQEIPDSAAIQNIANEEGISVQILETEQTHEYARVRVRGILGNQSTDAEVWVDFDTEIQLLMMEFVNKNPGILDHFNGMCPVFKEGATIKSGDKFVDAKYALVHAMLTVRKFAIRTANTKASKIVQMKLMNREFRSKEEIADEQAERDLVEQSKKGRV